MRNSEKMVRTTQRGASSEICLYRVGARWPTQGWVIAALPLILLSSFALLNLGCSTATEEASAQNSNSRPGLVIQNPPPANNTDNRARANERPARETAVENPAMDQNAASAPFYVALEKALARRQLTLAQVCSLGDPVARRVLEDYGAMFMAAENVLPPPVCVFGSEADALAFQKQAQLKTAMIGGARIELQPSAMDALLAARGEAHKDGLDITPRGGAEAARRSYADTVRLWNTRFLPALVYWNKRGRLTDEEVARLKKLPLRQQVAEVLALERKRIFFSKDLSKSILYSIAAPGTSQHMTGLALDVSQFGNARVRQILARHGWFQTVKSDMPHFTYLGVQEKDLPTLGLRTVRFGPQVFWIPDLGHGR